MSFCIRWLGCRKQFVVIMAVSADKFLKVWMSKLSFCKHALRNQANLLHNTGELFLLMSFQWSHWENITTYVSELFSKVWHYIN